MQSSLIHLLLVLGSATGIVLAVTATFVDPRPTSYYTVTSLVHPSDIVLTLTYTSTAWRSTLKHWSTRPCVSLIEVIPGVTGWALVTSYQLAGSPHLPYRHTERTVFWTTLSAVKDTTSTLCSATLVLSSVIAAATTLLATLTNARFVSYTTARGVCTYSTEPNTRASTTTSLPLGEGTIFTITQPYTVTATSYISVLSLTATTYTQTQCVNPTVTVVTPSTVTVSAWPAGTTTITSEYGCGLRGWRVPPLQAGIGPIFRSGGPPLPGLWPPLPGPGFPLSLAPPPASTSYEATAPETTPTYTVTHRTVVATVTAAKEEKWTAWITACSAAASEIGSSIGRAR
jgi:hypothetical protein